MADQEITKAFAESTTGLYTVQQTATALALGSGKGSDRLTSQSINTSTNRIMGKKVVVGIDVKGAYSNVAAPLSVELSPDGTNWSTSVATALADTTPDSTGVKVGLADLTDIEAPYARFVFNTNAENVGETGTLEFFFAYK